MQLKFKLATNPPSRRRLPSRPAEGIPGSGDHRLIKTPSHPALYAQRAAWSEPAFEKTYASTNLPRKNRA
jgi:hypothetical protein